MARARYYARLATIICTLLTAFGISPLAASADHSHVIQPGETLTSIAESYGVPLDSLARENEIVNPNVIYAGDNLYIPLEHPPAGAAPDSGTWYTIRRGDTLWSIAKLQTTTLDLLLKANPEIVDPDYIHAGQAIRIPGPAMSTQPANPGHAEIGALLAQHAAAYGLDPALLQALAWQESGWQQHVISPSGAIGVMQILPETGDWLEQDVVGAPLDIVNSPSDNIRAGAAFLAWLIERHGSAERALAAYYQGPGNLQRWGVLPETQRYVENVLAIRSYIARYGVPPIG